MAIQQAEPTVRVMSAAGRFIRNLPHSAVGAGIRTGRYTVLSRTRKRYLIVRDNGVRMGAELPRAVPFHYREQLGDTHELSMLKRPAPAGEHVKWDQNLTFGELRAGRIISQKTIEERNAERQ